MILDHHHRQEQCRSGLPTRQSANVSDEHEGTHRYKFDENPEKIGSNPVLGWAWHGTRETQSTLMPHTMETTWKPREHLKRESTSHWLLKFLLAANNFGGPAALDIFHQTLPYGYTRPVGIHTHLSVLRILMGFKPLSQSSDHSSMSSTSSSVVGNGSELQSVHFLNVTALVPRRVYCNGVQ